MAIRQSVNNNKIHNTRKPPWRENTKRIFICSERVYLLSHIYEFDIFNIDLIPKYVQFISDSKQVGVTSKWHKHAKA